MTYLEGRAFCKGLAGIAASGRKGTVHSIFSSAVNFIVDDQLICLLAGNKSLQPLSVVIDGTIDFNSLSVRIGDPLSFRRDPLSISIHADTDVTVGLTGASIVDLSMKSISGLAVPNDQLERLVQMARYMAVQPDATDGLIPLLGQLVPDIFPQLPTNHWCNFLLPRVRTIAPTLTGGTANEVEALGTALAGCGPGLTPSSDDFLVGLIASLYASVTAANPTCRKIAMKCHLLAKGAALGTGTISAAYLQSAGNGLFSHDILQVLRVFMSESSLDELIQAVKQLAQHGSTSGNDTLAGIWYGLYLAAVISNEGDVSLSHLKPS